MKTYFEPNFNGIDEGFSNITATMSPTSNLQSTMIKPTSISYSPTSQSTNTTTLSPKTFITPTAVSVPSSVLAPTKTSSVSTPSVINVPTVSSTPVNTAIQNPVAETGGYSGGGGGAIMSGAEETGIAQQEVDSSKKTGGLKDDYIFGIKRNYIFGIGLLAIGGFVYFKYIKK